MTKKFTLTCIFVLIIIISSCTPKQNDTIDTMKADLVFLIGDVTVNNVSAKPGTPIVDGDIIETKAQSSARIKIGEKTLIQIKENSNLVYKMDSENALQLNSGWMSGITRGKLLKQEYIIKTPTMIAAVRGTSYCLKVENPKSTYFCTCNGSIHQHGVGDEDNAEVITAIHHSGRRYSAGSDGAITTEVAGMLYHTDADIEEIAKLINETVDWGKP